MDSEIITFVCFFGSCCFSDNLVSSAVTLIFLEVLLIEIRFAAFMQLRNNSPTTWYQYVPYFHQGKNENDNTTVDVTSIINCQHRIYKYNMGIRETIPSVTNEFTNLDNSGYESVRNLQQIIDDIRFLANGIENQQLPRAMGTPLYGLPTYCEYLQQHNSHVDDSSRKCQRKEKKKRKPFIHKNCTVR